MQIYTLIPLLPLAASLLLALAGHRWQGRGPKLVVPALATSFALSLGAFVEVVRAGAFEIPLYRLLGSGDLTIELGLYVDQLTVLLLLLVTGVSAIVHVYSARYMIGDSRHSRFFAVTALFTAAMILLVMSRNLLMTYVCWEVMGLCSYLLISHYAERRPAHRAATKAFLVNAVADIGLGLGVILTFRTFGTLDIPQILASAGTATQTVNLMAWAGFEWHASSATLISLCFLLAAMGKSAQVPFHVWLPLAMEAPTPVSALIHAATMVNAGPFLLVRLSPIIVLSGTAMVAIATVGAITALFAAFVSLTQSDIKRILAYSTVSQIGFMVLACGVGAFTAAVFHLLAHGFLKAFLFLSTGSVLETVHGPTSHEPAEASAPRVTPLVTGALLMSLVPPFVLFSGPYANLWLAQNSDAAAVTFWLVGLGTVFFTAMYLFRGVTSAFLHGPPRGLDRSGASTVTPDLFSASHLVAIGLSASIALVALAIAWTWFAGFLSPALASASASVSDTAPTPTWAWVALPLAAAVLGFAFAYTSYRARRPSLAERWQWARPLYVYFLNKGYFDEIYDAYVVRPTIALARWLAATIDRRIDGAVVGIGRASVWSADRLWRWADATVISGAVEQFAKGVDAGGHGLSKFEPKTLQQHLLVIVFWLVAAIGVFYWTV